MKKIIAAMFTMALMISCSGGKNEQAASKDMLTVIAVREPSLLDPSLTNNSASSEIMKQVYDTLFNQDFNTMEAIPSLAERYEFENNEQGQPTRLRLFLKQGAKFHNGEEFTAADVKFTIERAIASPHIGHISGSISGVETINDYEVLLTLKYPFAPILNNLAHTAMSIMNEKAVLDGGDSYPQNPVGTGPYKFVRWVAGNRIELSRWDNYYGEKPAIKDITFRYIADPATALLELETGGADILFSLMPQDVKRVEDDSNLQLLRAKDLRLNYIGFNVRKHPFNDVRVRQAIAHAIDMPQLVNTVYQGVGSPGRAPISATVFASAANELPQYEYNLDKARQLLAEAGFPNGFSTTITTSEAANLRDTAEILQNMLARINITANIEIIEWAAYLAMTNRGEHEIFIHGWTTVTGDPDYGLEILSNRSIINTSGNKSFWSHPEVDRLLDAGRTETDIRQREQLYLEAQRIIHANVPWVYTQEGEVTVGVRSNVRGFVINPAGHHPLWTVYFE